MHALELLYEVSLMFYFFECIESMTLETTYGQLFNVERKVFVYIHYNFKRFFACMIFRTIHSVMVFFPGNLLIDSIILVSAFHLSCRFLALE